jgi:excisionase family DNA binding protein
MTMVKRFANYQLVKMHRSYSVEEVARLLGVHKNTVRTWIKEGLSVCDDRRPVLILGDQLTEFLKTRRAKNKCPCRLEEFYCFKCRLPRFPAGSIADCLTVSDKIGHLQAICPNCFRMMNRRVSLVKIGQFAELLVITYREV